MLFNKLRANPQYFIFCVVIKLFILMTTYVVLNMTLGNAENVLIYSLISFFMISPNPRVQLIVLLLCSLVTVFLYKVTLLNIVLMILLGAYWGGLMTVLIHNTSHEIIKPRWLNRVFGEIASFFLTIGFINFLYIHILHHVHSDEEKDPHPNIEGLNLIDYLASMGRNVSKVFKNYLPNQVCKGPLQYKLLVLSVLLNKLLIFQIFLLIFGPKVFTFFNLTCIISSQFLFAYINFYTHPNKDHGRNELINLDESYLDKSLNRLFFGILYHDNHHKYPKAANPMKYAQSNQKTTNLDLSSLSSHAFKELK